MCLNKKPSAVITKNLITLMDCEWMFRAKIKRLTKPIPSSAKSQTSIYFKSSDLHDMI